MPLSTLMDEEIVRILCVAFALYGIITTYLTGTQYMDSTSEPNEHPPSVVLAPLRSPSISEQTLVYCAHLYAPPSVVQYGNILYFEDTDEPSSRDSRKCAQEARRSSECRNADSLSCDIDSATSCSEYALCLHQSLAMTQRPKLRLTTVPRPRT